MMEAKFQTPDRVLIDDEPDDRGNLMAAAVCGDDYEDLSMIPLNLNVN
jgi:hypothetical protein